MNGDFNKPQLMGNCERCYYATDKAYRVSWLAKGDKFICHRYPQEVEKEPEDYCGEFAWDDSKVVGQ